MPFLSPVDLIYSLLIWLINSSLLVFAIIDAAPTTKYLSSALCSAMTSLFSPTKFCISSSNLPSFMSSESIIILSAFSFAIILIMANFSIWFKLTPFALKMSMSLALISTVSYSNILVSFLYSTALLFGVTLLESFTPILSIIFSFFSGMTIPATTIGPRTGPLPASSNPNVFIV